MAFSCSTPLLIVDYIVQNTMNGRKCQVVFFLNRRNWFDLFPPSAALDKHILAEHDRSFASLRMTSESAVWRISGSVARWTNE